MKVIKPAVLTSALLVSTTATESNAEWSAATSYAVDALCTLAATQRTYKCVLAPCLNKDPATQALYWVDVGPSNRWAMFDTEVSTQTEKVGDLTTVVKPGYVNSIALFNIVAVSLTVTMRDSLAGPVVYTKTISLEMSFDVITDWYMYFFEPFDPQDQIVLTDLPPYVDGHITVTLSGALVNKVGIIVYGTVYDLGVTEYAPTIGITDYSRKDTNAVTGATSFTRRAYSKRMSARMMVEQSRLKPVQKTLADLRATPCAWMATDSAGYEPLTFFGFYKDFSIEITYPNYFYTSLEIEGLI